MASQARAFKNGKTANTYTQGVDGRKTPLFMNAAAKDAPQAALRKGQSSPGIGLHGQCYASPNSTVQNDHTSGDAKGTGVVCMQAIQTLANLGGSLPQRPLHSQPHTTSLRAGCPAPGETRLATGCQGASQISLPEAPATACRVGGI